MNDFRAVVAIFISCASSYLVYDLFATGFSSSVFGAALFGPQKLTAIARGMRPWNLFLIYPIPLVNSLSFLFLPYLG